MGIFKSTAENVAKGFDWGVTSAQESAEAIVNGAKHAGAKTVDGVKYVGEKVVDGAKYAGAKVVDGARYAGERVADGAKYAGAMAVDGARYAGEKMVDGAKYAGNKTFQRVRSALDNRDTYSLRGDIVQPCPQSNSGHPNPNDGRFMGANSCPCKGDSVLTEDEPSQGVMPDGCKPGCGKPKIYFTNGINNTEKNLCATILAIAESQCAEVVGIYNATYADKTKLEGKGSGTANDIVDCMDAIDESGKSAAASKLKDQLVKDLSEGKNLPIKVFAHSEGGLNTQTALREAQKDLASQQLDKLMDSGVPIAQARAESDAYATRQMGNVHVTSFGTAENGWVPGPQYTQYENTRDAVPKAIKFAQFMRQKGTTPTTTLNRYVQNRGFVGEGLPGHGMADIYIPMLNEKNPAKRLANGKCC
jgi:hypothetical protein